MNIKRTAISAAFSLIILASVFPAVAFAVDPAQPLPQDKYGGLMRCSGVKLYSGEVQCNLNSFLGSDGIIADVINDLFYVSIPVAIILSGYAGFLYMTGIEKNMDKAKSIFKNVAIGFIIMLVAFTVIHTVVAWIVDPRIGANSLVGN